MIDTKTAEERFKIKRYWLWVWKQMGKLKSKKRIVNGRVKDFYDPQEIEKILGGKYE